MSDLSGAPVFGRAVLVLAFTSLPLVVPLRAQAFDVAGHYYSSTAVLLATLTQDPQALSPKEIRVIGFCTELPDEVHELDAVTAFKDCSSPSDLGNAAQLLFHSPRPSAGARRVATVQQLLHGLTGGSAQATLNAAVDLVARLLNRVTQEHNLGTTNPNDLCAFGFSLHLLGDSIAHDTFDYPCPYRKAQTRIY